MDEESGLAMPQHRDTMRRNQKQLPYGSAPGLGAARTRADVRPLGLASPMLLEPSGLWVCRGQRAPVQAHRSAACWHRPRTAVLWGMGRAQTKEAGAKTLLQLCQDLCLPGRELLPFYQGDSECGAWPVLVTPGFTVL